MKPAPVPIHDLFRNSAVKTIVTCTAVLGCGYLAALAVLKNDTSLLLYALLGCVVLVFVFSILSNWRRGLYIFFGWLLVEDLARKFLGNNMVIFFAKDLILALIYITFLAAARREGQKLFRPPFAVPLLLFFWFGVMQIFNPSSPHIAFGLLGVKLFYFYMPLVALGYSFFDSEEVVRHFFFANCIAAGIIAVLGAAQSIIGPSFLNPATLQDDIRELSTSYRMAPISGVIVYRPNGVFVSGGRFANYLIVSWLVVFGFSGYLLLSYRKGRAYVFLAMAAIAAAIVLCASRGAFLWTLGSFIVCAFAFVWGAPWRQKEVLRVIRTIQRGLLGVFLAFLVLFLTYPAAILGRLAVYDETLSPDRPTSELVWRIRDYPLRNMMGAFENPNWPYGHGIGTTGLGVQYIARFLHVRPISGVESGFGTLVFEMGILGLLLWLAMSVAIMLSAWKVVRKLRGSAKFPMAFMIFWYALLLLLPMTFVSMPAYQDYILNAYLWLLLGLLFRLPELASKAQPEVSQKQVAQV